VKSDHEGDVEERPVPADLVDVVGGMPRCQRAAILPMVIKEIVAGRISSAEASEIAKAMKH
jgi:hypothetical protein